MQTEGYTIKRIIFNSEEKSIITQNFNGPCPLLAIANLLILENKLFIHSDYSCITHENLITMIGNKLMEIHEQVIKIQSYQDENRTHRLNDAITMLPKFAYGLDVNVKFSRYLLLSVLDFEFTADCELFELLNIQLLHGWVYENDAEKEALKNLSYNQAVDFVLSNPNHE